nr:MAG TPA: Peptidoglycan endopeptidase [Caudoviricetes sp.]
MWRRRLSVLLFAVLCVQVCLQPVYCLELTDEEAEAILSEAELIRNELNGLKITLLMLESALSEQKQRLAMLEARLKKALQSLESSEADLIQSKKELETVKGELEILRQDVIALNKLYLKQKREKMIWMTAAISFGVGFTGLAIYVLYTGVKK